jgi:methyl-accepting chemotaxis protein
MESDPADSWYFSSLKGDKVLVTGDAREIRTSARVMDDGHVWGAVCLLSNVSELTKAVLPSGSAALISAAGDLVRLQGEVTPAAVSAALGSLPGNDQPVILDEAVSTRAGLAIVVRTPARGWYLCVSSAVGSALSGDRILWLAGVPATTLLLLLLTLLLTSGRRMRTTEARLVTRDEQLHAAAEEFALIRASARGAETAAAQLQALAERLGAEAAAAAATGAEADALFSRAEARETELRAGIAGRLPLIGRLVAAVREAIDRSRMTETAARIVGTSASRAEEELSRVITFSAASSHAVDKASRTGSAIGEAMDRIRLLTLNAALEAARGAVPGQGFARIADEVKGMAEETAARARALSATLTEAAGSVEGASRAAQEAGRAVHEAAADAARVVGGGWEEVTQLLSQTENANVSAARLKEDASSTDRGRSALEGFARIVARIGSLAAEVAHVAGRAGADAAAITRSVSENRSKGKIS